MRSKNERISILSEAEQSALYDVPDFDDKQRLDYLNLTADEQALMRSRSSLSAQVHCALQLGYFKAKHLFFRVCWDEVQEDTTFILQEYFPDEIFSLEPITKHQYYAQCQLIATHFGYQSWSLEFESLLCKEAERILHRDVSPQFIVMELLVFLREQKIMRPGYSAFQLIIRTTLKNERRRLGVLIHETLSDADKLMLNTLLVEEKTLSGLEELRQDAKDFKARMMSAEREKLIAIKPLYTLTQSLLNQSKLSHQNICYYASLIHYYTIHDLRKRLKTEQTYLYLLCYIWQRYQQLNDNLIDAFFCCLRQLEFESKEKATEAFSQYAIQERNELLVMRRLARVFTHDEVWPDTVMLGEIRKEVFATIISKDALQNKVSHCDESLKEIDFKWRMIDKLFHRYQLQLRPLMMALDFSSTTTDSPWFAAITWFKQIFATQSNLDKCNVNDCPAGTLPKRIKKYLLDTKTDGKEKLQTQRYEFWIYRQLQKRLKSGHLYLADSVHHRSLQQELAIAHEKVVLAQQLDIPALRKPIGQLLDDRIAELSSQWNSFNRDLSQGKLKHLRYDTDTKTLHLKKSKDERAEALQHHFYQQLPICDVTDVLRFVKERSRYSSAFTHIQPRYAKIPADEDSLDATIIAQALNNGNLNMADISDIPYDRLCDTYQSFLRLKTLKKANDLISEDIAKMPIFSFYSLDMMVLYGGLDGQKLETEPTLKARSSRKYFRKGKGVVAYTMLFNHIPLQVELIGAHDHESYFAFDIWYNNTTNIVPEAITGDMHIINKANFAIMDWFDGKLCPRFTNMQAQVKHLYCGDDLAQYEGYLIKPAGRIDRQLIEAEWPNITPIISALGLKEITQSILIKKLCTYTTDNRTRKAILEYDKLIRSIYTLKYLQDRKLQRDVHRSQNRVESYHQLRAAIATAYGRKQLAGRGERELEISNQCGRLVANAIIHYNSAILSRLKQKYEAEGNEKGLAILRKISPAAWRHIHFQGHFIFSGEKIIDLDAILHKVFLNGLTKTNVSSNHPEILPVYA